MSGGAAGNPPIPSNVPRVIRRGRLVAGVPPAFPPITREVTASGPSQTPQGATFSEQMLAQIRNFLAPDNYQNQLRFPTAQLQVGKAYDYVFPGWCRHWLLTNRSGGTGAAGQIYYWFDQPSQGNTVLPQYYATLTAGQSISENSDYKVLSIYADPTMTDQAWEIRWMGLVVQLAT